MAGSEKVSEFETFQTVLRWCLFCVASQFFAALNQTTYGHRTKLSRRSTRAKTGSLTRGSLFPLGAVSGAAWSNACFQSALMLTETNPPMAPGPCPIPGFACSSSLAELRQSHGMSIQQISERTKISIRYLKAIEAGDFGKLPGGIYGRSYIRQYAHAIECNADQLLLRCPVELRYDAPEQDSGRRDGIRFAGASVLLARLARLTTRWQRVLRRPSSDPRG